MPFHNKNCTHLFIMTFHNKNCTHIFIMTFHNKNCSHIFIMTFHNKNEIEVQRSKVNIDVPVVDTYAHGLRARANTGESIAQFLVVA